VILDGEGVICGPDGVSDFDRMRAVLGPKGSPDVFLYAFEVLEMDGHDLRAQSWDTRRALLTQLLDRCQDDLRLSEHVEDTNGASYSGRHVSWGLRGSSPSDAIAAIARGGAANGSRSRTAPIPPSSEQCSSL
jgi:bifunctional non-homologous end joining protein LigD